ncbi:BrnT family toxin [Litoreibacter albidus]|uniref:BrnT family toxin n=1 Tax=Litoreibacter albidus TaxID=670155 RepID=UPI0037357F77
MFEWDENKRKHNHAKHGVDFLDAALIFENPILIRKDTRQDYGETRLISLGMVGETVYAVTYTMRGETIRIISAWQGGRKEYEQYKNRIP